MKQDPTREGQRLPEIPKPPEAARENPSGAAAQAGGSHRDSAQSGGAGTGPGKADSLLPAITSPKGGGAIRGIGEKFTVNAATGTTSLSVPIATSPGRSGFGPELSLAYDSGNGNGPFGLGFSLSAPAITRKTDRGLPRYWDGKDSDVFVLSGAEDLVPERDATSNEQLRFVRGAFTAYRYRPRVEGAFARIERWVHGQTGAIHWRVTTKENVVHVYGRAGAETQIVDPSDPGRIFGWLIEESRDDKGNVVRYQYKSEDGDGVTCCLSEKSRFDRHQGFVASAQRYLKRILYGNRQPYTESSAPDDYLFEVVFDYGEHGHELPTYSELQPWPVRLDPFSSFRAGFEVRTYRMCWRVMMFHRSGADRQPLLVKSTEFRYESSATVTYLLGVSHWGYITDSSGTIVESAHLPELSFEFQPVTFNDELSALPSQSLEGLRGGIDGNRKQWVDLDGEGISGVLIDADGAWFYKSNLGGGRLSPPKCLASLPSPGSLAGGVQKLEDLDGNGQLELVQHGPPLQGYFARTPDGDFETLRTFQSLPNIDWNDPNLRFIDLDGDGLADLLITEESAFVWYRSKGRAGFDDASRIFQPRDEEQGPAIVFADGTQSIQLADMSGDGLVDIVRVRNGEVCYWPNLGYGRFGAKITLESSPNFAPIGQFDAKRVRFFDIDGSGTSDLLYLGQQGIDVYLNESGNRLGVKQTLRTLPPVDGIAQITVVDLLGRGTGCLVWSSSLPNTDNRPIFFIDLMGGVKPHLLSTVNNNLGAQTRITYSTSTAQYLKDKAEAIPWLTRLPFPVQVVERIEHEDLVSKCRLVTEYRYHHGFFDGEEREFRGFACVEQWDAEQFEIGTKGELDQPPVHTKTWFHTGAWLEKERLEQALKLEYFPEGPKDERAPEALFLPDTILPEGMTTQDEREAARALRGHVLRTEIYANDGTELAQLPYVVTEASYSVHCIQSSRHAPTGSKHGVFLAFPCETLTIHTERHQGDPRIAHDLVLAVDDYGNVTRQASVVYGRLQPTSHAEQRRVYATLTETNFINEGGHPDWYRASIQCEQATWELTGVTPRASSRLWDVESLASQIESLPHIPYETPVSGEVPARRLVERKQQRFYSNDLCCELALGAIESLALPYRTYHFALTPGLVAQIADTSAELVGTAFASELLVAEGRYESRPDGYWAPSGRVEYDAAQFYLPVRALDPFGATHHVKYDEFSLLVEAATDPLGNCVVASNDYRVLAPTTVLDPNLNRGAVGFDALGMVLWSAVMGKADHQEGDTPEHPTARFEYHLHEWAERNRPAFVRTNARERHFFPDQTDGVPWQESLTYSDGFGRIVMHKVQAEAGPVPGTAGMVTDRWVGNGRTVFNNKGNPVKQYEPFFSASSDYEDEAELVERGVTPIIHYDPLGRVIRTDLPNGTFSKVVFDAWRQQNWDPNDTVLESAWYKERTEPSKFVTDAERRAARLAAKHANTPSLLHLDSLGRPFLGQAAIAAQHFYDTRTELDIEGNPLGIVDALGIRTIEQRYDVLGRRIAVTSPDAGKRLTIADVAGKPLRSWDSRGHTTRARFDALQRPTHVLSHSRASSAEQVVTRTIYGESVPDSQARNLRGQTYLVFDGAGMVKTEELDFKGNLLSASRHLAAAYESTPTWEALPELSDAISPDDVEAAALANGLDANPSEAPTRFATHSEFDALNRAVRSVAPDGSVATPVYNRANFLERMLVETAGTTRAAVHSMAYNEKGQRVCCEYNDQTQNDPVYTTEYSYDPVTFRLKSLVTRRKRDDVILQHLLYTYDPAGNIVEITDDSSALPIFANPVAAEAHGLYEYDALYRLIRAEGREHPGQQVTEGDRELTAKLPHANDTSALVRYREAYDYDPVGNILRIHHQPLFSNSSHQAWERRYRYAYQAAEADPRVTPCNRLLATSLPGDQSDVFSATYDHDPHGSMTRMPHLSAIQWDYADQMQRCQIGIGAGAGNVHFTYDGAGQRVRKVYVHSGIVEERIYLGGYEIYRRRGVAATTLDVHRATLHVMDDQRRIAMIENTLVDTIEGLSGSRWRFQLDNHLGSATLELDEAGNVISYEEYHPYGTSALRVRNLDGGFSQKRYRYTGKEKDEETGLYYHVARYYASWLGRWTAADPLGVAQPGRPDLNLFAYVGGRVIVAVDPGGMNTGYNTDTALQMTVPTETSYDDSANEAEADQMALRSWRPPGYTDPESRARDHAAKQQMLFSERADYLTGQLFSNVASSAALIENHVLAWNRAHDLPDYWGMSADPVAARFWACPAPTQLEYDIIAHYLGGSGARFHISIDRMPEVQAFFNPSWGPPDTSDPKRPRRRFNDQLKSLIETGKQLSEAAGNDTVMNVQFSGSGVSALELYGLGQFEVHYRGNLKVSSNAMYEFSGEIAFVDVWDLDRHPDPTATMRTFAAQIQIIVGRMGTPGTDFVVTSDWIGGVHAKGELQEFGSKGAQNLRGGPVPRQSAPGRALRWIAGSQTRQLRNTQ